MVFMPNITTNHAITQTYNSWSRGVQSPLRSLANVRKWNSNYAMFNMITAKSVLSNKLLDLIKHSLPLVWSAHKHGSCKKGLALIYEEYKINSKLNILLSLLRVAGWFLMLRKLLLVCLCVVWVLFPVFLSSFHFCVFFKLFGNRTHPHHQETASEASWQRQELEKIGPGYYKLLYLISILAMCSLEHF